jgi:pyridoxamine 5'-phosphate oxidase
MMSTCQAWRVALEGALDHGRHSPETRYVQVATVRPDSCPANRTLVFRAFLDPGHQLVFTTDLRTAKITYLEPILGLKRAGTSSSRASSSA